MDGRAWTTNRESRVSPGSVCGNRTVAYLPAPGDWAMRSLKAAAFSGFM